MNRARDARNVSLAVVLAGLAAYLAIFFAGRLSSLEGTTGATWRRAWFFSYLLLPDELVQNWCGEPAQFSLLDRLPTVAVAAAIVITAWALGRLLLDACRADRGLNRLERIFFATGVGLNAVSTYVLAVGLAGWLKYPAVFVVPGLVVLALAGWFCSRGGAATTLNSPSPDADAIGPDWLWLAAPFVAVILLGAMLPPIEFDVREYHLQAPKEFFQQGRITFLPHNLYANMALGSEMLSLLGMAVTRDWWLGALVGKTVIGLFAPLTALGLVAAGRRFLTPSAGTVAAILYLSTPWIVQVSTIGFVEGASAYYLLAATYAVLLASFNRVPNGPRGTDEIAPSGRAPRGALPTRLNEKTSDAEEDGRGQRSAPTDRPEQRRGTVLAAAEYGASSLLRVFRRVFVSVSREAKSAVSDSPLTPDPSPARGEGSSDAVASNASAAGYPLLLLAGYLAGAAVATKYPAVLFVVLPLAVGIAVAGVRGSVVRVQGSGFRVQSIWKSANLLLVFSFAVALGCGLWFGKNWVLTGNPTYPLMYGLFGGKTLTAAKAANWNWVHLPHDFSLAALHADLVRVIVGSDWLGPLLMPLAAMAFVRRENRRLALGLLAYFGLVIAVWWFAALRIDRYWIPALPLVALLAGMGACWQPTAAWRRWLAALLIVSSIWAFLAVAAIPGPGGYNRYFVSLDRLRVAPERVDPWHRYFNGHVKEGRLLLVGDAEVFDLEVPVLYNTWLDDSIFERLIRGRSPDQILHVLHDSGITYLYVHWGEVERYRATGYGSSEFIQPALFDNLVKQGVLGPLSPIADHPGRGYRVK